MLSGVVLLAVTPSINGNRLYVQDESGGPYSAIAVHCSPTSMTHPCPSAATNPSLPIGDLLDITGDFTHNGSGSDDIYATTITDQGAGFGLPSPSFLTLGDVTAAANRADVWYSRVQVGLNGDTLLAYDWSPIQMKHQGAVSCFYYFGFGMIPASVGAAQGPACSGLTQPAPPANVSSQEVLIGTDFYTGFKVAGDCACAASHGDPLLMPTSTLSGTLSGILIFDPTGYQYVAPQYAADAPITNTM
jgi:hypothetical protein